MGRPRKVPLEAPVAEPQTFAAYVAAFKAAYPEEWEGLRLCPLQHGLEEMERLLG